MGTADFPFIENEILDRGMDAQVTSTGCMKASDYGPVMVVQPAGVWYGPVESEDVIDEILDAIEDDAVAEDYVIQ
ncbi:MAG: (2Fe-2S) ferredoxin domain-containing protein [Desulfococcaceae bacterium]